MFLNLKRMFAFVVVFLFIACSHVSAADRLKMGSWKKEFRPKNVH